MSANSITVDHTKSSYRWVILAACAVTPLLVVTLPNLSLPPMFVTISNDINLSLVEIGTIWGAVAFAGVFFSLIGGTLGDRFGTRATLFVSCLFTGIFGIARSFAVDFTTLLIASLLLGIFQMTIPVILFKLIRQWFPPQQLGMASGVVSAGFAGGLMLGPLLSTSLILPALGGWRQVLVFYGIIAIGISLLWLVVHPTEDKATAAQKPRIPLSQSLRHVTRLRELWILAIAGMGISGCFQGFTGYLPTYLKAIGWAELDADRALSAFFITSLLAVVPLSILSDRFHWRRGFLIVAATVLSLGIGSLSVIEGGLIVLVIAATGLFFDGFMAIINASALEVKGVDFVYAGTAVGFANMLRNLGGTFSPPVGNSLAVYGPSVPFLFWGGLGLCAVMLFIFAVKPSEMADAGEEEALAVQSASD